MKKSVILDIFLGNRGQPDTSKNENVSFDKVCEIYDELKKKSNRQIEWYLV